LPEENLWAIEFYSDVRGRQPAADFIRGFRGRMLSRLQAAVEYLAEVGIDVAMPLARPVTGYRFWELRVQAEGNSVRIFYFAFRGRRMILLHGYDKRSRKAPRHELEIAAARMDDFLRRNA
jgi:phage-related protein